MSTKLKLLKGCILLILQFCILFTFYYLLVGRMLTFPFNLILSSLGSFFVLISIGNFIAAKAKFSELGLIKSSLTRRNILDLKDGEKLVVFGQILPNDGQPILSPLTQEKCVFYTYDIYHWVWRGTGQDRKQVKDYDYGGFYLTPSSINTPSGKIRLLTFPTLQGFEKKTYFYSDTTVAIYKNAFSYIQITKFEEFGRMGFDKIGKAYQMIKDIVTDDDGYVRKDTKYTEEPFDLKTRFLEEQFVKEGEDVCLLGTWSTAKQGIVTDLSKPTVVTLTKGLPEQTIKVVKNEVFKKISEGILYFFVINLIIGIIWWIFVEGPKYGTVIITETRNGSIVKQEITGPTKELNSNNTNTFTTEPTPVQVKLSSYSNSIGRYSYQYLSSWKHSEIVNRDLNSNDQRVTSVFSQINNPQYAPMFGSLSVSYQLDGGQCIEKDEGFLKSMVVLKTRVGDQVVDAYERQELNENVNRIIYQRYIFIPKDDRCYTIVINDQQGNPNSDVFKDILSSFKFLD